MSQLNEPNNNIKTLSEEITEFTCEGSSRHYIVLRDIKKLTIEHFRIFQELLLGHELKVSADSIIADILKAMELLKDANTYDAHIVLYKIIEKVKEAQKQKNYDSSLRISTLFIYEKNEDRTVYDEAVMQSKIDDWNKHYDMDFFFSFPSDLLLKYKELASIILEKYLEPTKLTNER